MRHFVVEIIYTAEIEKINEVRDRHRAFLSDGYEKGIILMSGPQEPRTGGIIIARANSADEIKEFLSNDPYQKEKAAEYRFIEFIPVHFQDLITGWL